MPRRQPPPRYSPRNPNPNQSTNSSTSNSSRSSRRRSQRSHQPNHSNPTSPTHNSAPRHQHIPYFRSEPSGQDNETDSRARNRTFRPMGALFGLLNPRRWSYYFRSTGLISKEALSNFRNILALLFAYFLFISLLATPPMQVIPYAILFRFLYSLFLFQDISFNLHIHHLHSREDGHHEVEQENVWTIVFDRNDRSFL